jgi:hypothetical protein
MASNPVIVNPAQSDPLAQLRDIHLPAPIEAWPPAPGWFLLAALGLIVLAGGLFWLYRRWRGNRYRREAARQLQLLLAKYERRQDEMLWLSDCAELLKRTALTRYPREQVANLTGEAWVRFLDRTAGTEEFSMGAGQALIDGNYRPSTNVDVHKLHALAAHWIAHHGELPPMEDAA